MSRDAGDSPVRPYVRLIDALNCGAILIDRQGRILHVNQRLEQLLGVSDAELRARPLNELYSDEADRARVAAATRAFEERLEEEFYLPRGDGSRIPVVMTHRFLEREGPLREFQLITVIDITRQKTAESRERERYLQISELSDTILAQALDLKHYNERLEQRVRERTRDLADANMDAIYMLAVASESRDIDTGAHVLRIRQYCDMIAVRMGLTREAEQIAYSAILHDVGKIAVPDSILKKPGPLTSEERVEMEAHTIHGERILSTRPFFELARRIARSHHENWDGSGYPDGVRGDDILVAARITHVADVYDALTSPRVYKNAWSSRQAIETIAVGAGTIFDPDVVDAFTSLSREPEFIAVRANEPTFFKLHREAVPQ